MKVVQDMLNEAMLNAMSERRKNNRRCMFVVAWLMGLTALQLFVIFYK